MRKRFIWCGMGVLALLLPGCGKQDQTSSHLEEISKPRADQPASTFAVAKPAAGQTTFVSSRPYLGVSTRNHPQGLALSVVPEGPAHMAGLKSGDIIFELAGKAVKGHGQLQHVLHGLKPHQKIQVRFYRDKKIQEVQLTLGERRTGPLRLGKVTFPDEGQSAFTQRDYFRRPLPKDPNPISRETLVKLAVKAGSRVAWMYDLQTAQARAQKENRPLLISLGGPFSEIQMAAGRKEAAEHKSVRLPGSPTFQGRDYDFYLRMTVFSWDSTVDLINHQFIPVRTRLSKAQAKEWGLTRYAFIEPGLIFVHPDGSLLHVMDRLATFNEALMYDQLRKVLALKPALKHVSTKAKNLYQDMMGARLLHPNLYHQIALAQLAEGDLDHALDSAEIYAQKGGPQAQPGAQWLKARVLARKGKLDEASKICTQNKIPTLGVLRMHLMMRKGHYLPAYALGRKLLSGPLEVALETKVHLAMGQLAWLLKRDGEALRHFKTVVTDHPSAIEAPRCALYLLGEGPLTHGMEVLADLSVGNALLSNTHKVVDHADLPEVIRGALQFLFVHQRPEGGWFDSRYDFMGVQHRHNTYMAISGLAASAVFDWQEMDSENAEQSLAAAERYLRELSNMSQTAVEKTYAYAYGLKFLVRQMSKTKGQQAKLLSQKAHLWVKRLVAQQSQEGAWGHEYYNPFVTATVIHALYLARAQGVSVPQASLSQATKVLLAFRGKQGAFPYYYKGHGRFTKDFGRSPFCEWALWTQEKSKQAALVKSLEAFCKNAHHLKRVRQYDYHADSFGNGGFFYYYDVYGASLAATAVADPQKREAFMKEVLDLILEGLELDGSFIDSPNIGKSYGTAMALLSLKNLEEMID